MVYPIGLSEWQAAAEADIATRAAAASPAFTGTPTAPTASSGTNTTQIATTAFVTAVSPTAWTDWTPTFSGMTVGNGTVFAKYRTIDGMCWIWVKYQRGSTSTHPGNISFTLPVTADSSGAFPIRVPGSVYDSDLGEDYAILGETSGADCILRIPTVTGSYLEQYPQITSAVPFTWATGDRFYLFGAYPTV